MNLTISTDEVCETARLDPADSVATADAAFVIAQEQAGIEGSVDPAAWSLTADNLAIIRRAAVKLLGAELIEMRGRAEGASGTFVGAGITIANVPDHAAALRAEANAALKPYLRRGVIFGPDISVGVSDRPETGVTAQRRRFSFR